MNGRIDGSVGSVGSNGRIDGSSGSGNGSGVRGHKGRRHGNNALGRYGEDLAARRLRESGMVVLDRNWRCREGEIDIVARDADALVVCEVKTRRPGPYGHPTAAIGPSRAARLRRLASHWLAQRWIARYGRPPTGGVRIDLVGIVLPERGAPRVQHLRGVA